jgi:hypothetical protein
MSEKSRPGETPWVYMFKARVTMSTLPVRSPLPNRQPSTRSAPAIMPSSAAATPLPRSLCGWRREHHAVATGEIAVHPLDLVGIDVGRRHLHRGREVEDDLVVRRRAPFGGDGVADFLAKSSSVAEKVSGLYSRAISVPHSTHLAPICLMRRTADTASALTTCGFSMPNTTSRKVGEVAL